MHDSTGVAVVATHLAAADRRALSQAWYSALHLAERAAPRRPRFAPATRAPGLAPPLRSTASPAPAPAAAARIVRAACSAAPGSRGKPEPGGAERRAPASELARRIETAVARRRPNAAGAGFVLRAGGGRVHVVVRCIGARTRIVAVCAPSLRERVERALAQARFALAGRGVPAEVA